MRDQQAGVDGVAVGRDQAVHQYYFLIISSSSFNLSRNRSCHTINPVIFMTASLLPALSFLVVTYEPSPPATDLLVQGSAIVVNENTGFP